MKTHIPSYNKCNKSVTLLGRVHKILKFQGKCWFHSISRWLKTKYLFWFLSLLQVFWQHRLCMRGQALKLHNSFLFISLISFIYQHYCSQKWLEPQSRYNRGCLSPISDMDFQFRAIWAAQGSKENCQLLPTFPWEI